MLCPFRILLLATVAGAGLAARAQEPAPAPRPPAVMLGSAWYPELSTPSQIETDLTLMQACGLKMVRVGEYAWDSLEPEEGHYDLDWLDRAVAAAARHGIFTVIGTPSDGMPRWLAQKYPDVLRIDVDGRRSRPDSYRIFSYASPRFRELCRQIDEQLARRFGRNPWVIGWQIGNEPTEESYDPAAQADFRDWLRAKYGTLEALNRQLMSAYWSHRMDSWDQVLLPAGNGGPLPGLFLDSKRFVTSEWRRFHQNQAEVLRRYADPRQFITTNLGGLAWADRFNRHEVTKDFDLAAWDDYVGRERQDPSGHGSTYESLLRFDPARNGAAHDLVRGWKGRNFWVMEMQPAFVDWAPVSNAVGPGVTRTMIWQAIGHGADGISFWQWRAGRSAVGQYHGTLVGPDTTPVPVYAEVKRSAGEVAACEDVLAGTSPQSQAAILYDYDSRWSIDLHRQTQRYDPVEVLLGYYRALRLRTPSVDIVDPSCDLEKYKLIAAPTLTVLPAGLARRLREFVERGGYLVLGPRSGLMDEWDALNLQRQPGPLAAALGGRVEQYYALTDDVPVAGKWGRGQASIWAEQLSTASPETRVLLRYGEGNGWLAGLPAAIARRVGRGRLCYIGAVLDDQVMSSALAELADGAAVERPAIAAPPEVEVCRRVGRGREVFVVINHGRSRATIALPPGMTNVLLRSAAGTLTLSPLDVAVLSRPVSLP